MPRRSTSVKLFAPQRGVRAADRRGRCVSHNSSLRQATPIADRTGHANRSPWFLLAVTMLFASVFVLVGAISTNAVGGPLLEDSSFAFESWYERRSDPTGDTLLAIACATNVSQTTLELCASFRFAGGYRPSQES